MVYLISGLPGTGKSFLAKALSAQLGIPRISSDVVRNEFFPEKEYSETGKTKVYQKMLSLLKTQIKISPSVILDATFSKEKYRKIFLDFLEGNQEPYCYILVEATEETIKKRLLNKRKESDADFNVYLIAREYFEPLSCRHTKLKSDKQSLTEMINAILKACN